jgi:hypothetical protein
MHGSCWCWQIKKIKKISWIGFEKDDDHLSWKRTHLLLPAWPLPWFEAQKSLHFVVVSIETEWYQKVTEHNNSTLLGNFLALAFFKEEEENFSILFFSGQKIFTTNLWFLFERRNVLNYWFYYHFSHSSSRPNSKGFTSMAFKASCRISFEGKMFIGWSGAEGLLNPKVRAQKRLLILDTPSEHVDSEKIKFKIGFRSSAAPTNFFHFIKVAKIGKNWQKLNFSIFLKKSFFDCVYWCVVRPEKRENSRKKFEIWSIFATFGHILWSW